MFDQGDSLGVAWYTYDPDNEAVFLLGQASRQADGSFSGPLFRQANGTPFNQINGSVASATANQIGSVTLRFASGSSGSFEYSVGAVCQTKTISRLRFGSTASVCSTAAAD